MSDPHSRRPSTAPRPYQVLTGGDGSLGRTEVGEVPQEGVSGPWVGLQDPGVSDGSPLAEKTQLTAVVGYRSRRPHGQPERYVVGTSFVFAMDDDDEGIRLGYRIGE